MRVRAEIATRVNPQDLGAYIFLTRQLAANTGRHPALQEALFRAAEHAEVLAEARSALLDGDAPLARDHIAELGASKIEPEHAARAGIWSEADPTMIAALRGHRYATEQVLLVFPYRRPGRDVPEFIRSKRAGAGKKNAYRQPGDVPTGIYFPPNVVERGDLRRADVPLVIVEGEKKTLALDRLKYAVIGLPGVWCARDTSLPDGTNVIHPAIREEVVVVGLRLHLAIGDPFRSCRRRVDLAP